MKKTVINYFKGISLLLGALLLVPVVTSCSDDDDKGGDTVNYVGNLNVNNQTFKYVTITGAVANDEFSATLMPGSTANDLGTLNIYVGDWSTVQEGTVITGESFNGDNAYISAKFKNSSETPALEGLLEGKVTFEYLTATEVTLDFEKAQFGKRNGLDPQVVITIDGIVTMPLNGTIPAPTTN